MLQADEPLVLPIGTDVSAKYKGAFCEAKIQRVTRNLKIKVTSKNNLPHNIAEGDIQPDQTVKIGNWISIKSPHFNNSQITDVMVSKIFDQSLYTVVFDDGDEATLKRTSLCLKSGRHFPAGETLDQLPLTNPEHFGIPVNLGKLRSKGPNGSPKKYARLKALKNKSAANLSDSTDEEKAIEAKRIIKPPVRVSVLGKVVCVEYGDKRGSKNKDVWFPAMIVSPSMHVSTSGVNPRAEKDEYKVRSFRDERYYIVGKKDAREFNVEQNRIFATTNDCSVELRQAIEKAILYIEQKILPENWPPPRRVPKYEIFLEDTDDSLNETNDDETNLLRTSGRRKKSEGQEGAEENESNHEDDNSLMSEDDDFTDSDIQIEPDDDEEEKAEKLNRINKQEDERNLFVAQLYKFMDDRGTPINHTPRVYGRELNLYKLHRIMGKMGGPVKVTKQKRWKKVYVRLLGLKKSPSDLGELEEAAGLEEEDYTKSITSPPAQLRLAYKKYLMPFYDLNRKLGPANIQIQKNGTRPSRGERKREEERSRVNSTSSVSSNVSTPQISGKARKLPASSAKANKASTDLQAGSNDSSQQSGTTPTPASVESTRPSRESSKTPKVKPDDKRRNSKRKDFDSDSNEQITRLQSSSSRKDDTENEDSQMTGPSSLMDGDSDDDDGSNSNKVSKVDESQIAIGDGLKVKYGKGKQLKVYEAKVLKSEYDKACSRYKYLVHYYGWSSRYDEWIYRNRIVQVIRDKSPRRRSGKVKNKGEPLPVDSTNPNDDEDTGDNKIEVVVRTHPKSEAANNNKALKGTPQIECERRNRNKDEPIKERSASLSKVKSSDDLTRGRSRTSSFSQKESTFPVRKEKSAKTEDSAKPSPFTPIAGNSKRTKVQQTPISSLKDTGKSSTSSKAQINKKSDSEDESTKVSAKKEKKKLPDKSRPGSELKKRFAKDKRDLDQLDQPLDETIKNEGEEELNLSVLKKRRFEDSSLDKSNQKRSTPSDAYEFVDDEDQDEKDELPMLGKAGQSPATLPRSTKFLDLAKKDLVSKSRPSSDTSDVSKSDKANLAKKAESIASASPMDEDVSQNSEPKEPPPTESASVQVKEPVPPEPKTISPDLNQQPQLVATCSTSHSNTENFLQSEFLSADSTASLQSAGEDLEVQKILENTEPEKENEADAKSERSNSPIEKLIESLRDSTTSNASNKKGSNADEENVTDDDIDGSPLGPLVMAEEEDEEKFDVKSTSDDENRQQVTSSSPAAQQNKTVEIPCLSAQEAEDDKSLSEATQSADSGDSNQSKEKNTESTSSVDSLLLCEETVPASPPSSPPPISSQAPEAASLHHPAPNQTVQGEYFRSQIASHPNLSLDTRISAFLQKDASGFPQDPSLQPKSIQQFGSTPAFLANLHRNQLNAQPINLAPTANQPFSTLIAAAVSQQQVPISKPSPSKGPKTLNVIVPPNIASNIMKMDTSRMRSSREEEINDADDEGAPGMENDDDDDNDSDCEETKRFQRKLEQPSMVGRKRRAIRVDSKVSSSSSPVATGILSSQESSQDGDDHSIDEELQKMVADDMNLRSKSLKSDLDLKNDDDSMSGSHSRSNRDLEMKNFKSPAPSPKKRRRGRMRNPSQSDNRDSLGGSYSERIKERTLSYRPRGRHRHNTGQLNSDYSCYGSTNSSPRVNNNDSSVFSSALSSSSISAIIASLKPPEETPYDYSQFKKFDSNRYRHMTPIDMKLPPEDRIRMLKERLEHVRKSYFDIKTKVHDIDRKKKRAAQKKKDRERKELREQAKAAASAALLNSGSDSSSSSTKTERSGRPKRDNGSGNVSGRSSARLEDTGAADISESNLLTEEATT